MRTRKTPSDTDPGIEAIRLSLLREASVAKRVARARSLSRSVILLARRAIRRANPSLTEREADLIFVEKHYGQDLAEHLRQFLTQRTR